MLDYNKPDELPDGWYAIRLPYGGGVYFDMTEKFGKWEGGDDGRSLVGHIIAGPLDLPNLKRDLSDARKYRRIAANIEDHLSPCDATKEKP